MPLQLPARPLLLWAVRILSFAAMTVCFVLFGMKLNGSITSLAGCGSEGGCGQVLGSRWSEWFHVPVTLWAGLLYLGILCLTTHRVHRTLGRTGDQLLAAAGVILAGAAVYFLCLLYLNLEQNCPWCLALHLTGLTVAGILLYSAVQTQREGARGLLEAAALSGLAAIGVLAAGQVWGPRPQTYVLTEKALPTAAGSVETAPSSSSPREARVVSFQQGRFNYNAAALPIIGSPYAKFVLVEYFDYTCRSCRTMAGDLKALRKKWPDLFSVVVLPTPLNRACNPFLKSHIADHPAACELARLALAVWQSKPESFPEFHDYLFTLGIPVSEAAVREASVKAGQLTGASVLQAALSDPWVSSQITQNIGHFAQLTVENNYMPKLLVRDLAMLHGPVQDTGTFLRLMEQQFQPAVGTPVISESR